MGYSTILQAAYGARAPKTYDSVTIKENKTPARGEPQFRVQRGAMRKRRMPVAEVASARLAERASYMPLSPF